MTSSLLPKSEIEDLTKHTMSFLKDTKDNKSSLGGKRKKRKTQKRKI